MPTGIRRRSATGTACPAISQTIVDVTPKVSATESGAGTFRGAVRVYPTSDDLANRCEFRVPNVDLNADGIPWPGSSTTTITGQIEISGTGTARADV
jgi:S-DNA-T family DNA segregation ATPase FtsK/SpoIIIE